MYTLGHREVEICGVVAYELLFEANVCRVDAGVRVGLAENGDAGPHQRQRLRRYWHDAWICRKSRVPTEQTSVYLLLLDAVGGDRPNLGQHVLARIEYAVARAQCGLAVSANVPRETSAWLEFLVLVGEKTGRIKIGSAQITSVRRTGWRDGGIRKPLGIPAQTVVKSEVPPNFPGVLNE